ncbi:secondary thiamine-phosphate synthase enzyme YjbQ [Sulfurimonas indica]|uniref:secondary thiamine-phosphate synthase enzyme YjbQ n=1 Tax=Sulfurimonas indica TaxID=2508707 RepID=UPI001264B222|nr:secondary thiamine-phosphate synthase enzyme YjbQ [Sulfurimonas indica]
MQLYQTTLKLPSFSRGFHIITKEIEKAIEPFSVTTGVINLFIQHTSASLSINENVDPSVREDMESFFNELADEKTHYIHTYEGSDDMPAHIKSSLLGHSLTIPVTGGRLNLGTWQGVYLGEHRDFGGSRKIVITLYGV